ncbi:MAG: SDR family NAD(P)-dependent oxidoreductase [Turicibacter sp.]
MEIFSKVFLVTGSSSGIGLELTKQLLSLDAQVIGFDVKENKDISHPHFHPYYVDVSDEAAVSTSLQKAMTEFHALDGIINVAGISGSNQSIHTCTPAAFKRIVDTHLFGTYHVCYYGATYLKDRTEGCIINFSSLFAMKSTPNFIAYNAAKKAIISLTETLALEMAPSIRVNAVAPGFIETPMTQSNPNYDKMVDMVHQTYPLKRTGHPEHVVSTILFLIQNDFMTGETIAISGGAHL